MEPKYGTKVEPEPQHSLTNKPRNLTVYHIICDKLKVSKNLIINFCHFLLNRMLRVYSKPDAF